MTGDDDTETRDELIERARRLTAKAVEFRAAGDLSSAELAVRQSVSSYERAGSLGGQARSLRLAGEIYLDQGALADAVQAFDQARQVCEDAGQIDAAKVCAAQAHAAQARIDGAARAARPRTGNTGKIRAVPSPAKDSAPSDFRRRRLVFVAIAAIFALGAGVAVAKNVGSDSATKKPVVTTTKPTTTTLGLPSGSTAITTATTVPETAPAPTKEPGIYADPAWTSKVYPGATNAMVAFRGNPSRTYYGKGPVPKNPHQLWQYPKSAPMCSDSVDKGVNSTWCGMGWTGQVNVFNLNGKQALGFGAYDRADHVVDAATGKDLLKGFTTDDLAKGTPTVDPDGYPLMYHGSRDSNFRIYALDRDNKLTVLWSMNAADDPPILWNNDWDGSPLILNDYLIEGGENSRWYIIKLNRGYDANGKVTVNPQKVFNGPGWDQKQLDDIAAAGFNDGPEVSIENSLAAYKHIIYFANSGGLVQGWDTTGIESGVAPTRVFRFWTGEDTDASVVVDAQGMLYVNTEGERHNTRSKAVGHLMKLDPSKPDNPIVWSIQGDAFDGSKDGFWATPAIHGDTLIAARTRGILYGIDRASGKVLWEKRFPLTGDASFWASPVVVDNVLIQADCVGKMHAYDVSNPLIDPPELWSVDVPSDAHCIETTPVVFEGKIYIGSRNGFLYAFGD